WGACSEVQDRNELVVRDVIAAAVTSVKSGATPPASNAFKIGAYYEACVDTLGIDGLGTKPIDATMARIAKIASASEIPIALAELEATDGLAPFGVGAGADLKNSNRLLTTASQGGLSIGQRDYYLSPDTSMRKIRDAFVGYAAKMFELYGESAADAKAHAQTVLDIETKFAHASMDQVTLRNPNARYHVMSVAQLAYITPHFKWQSFISAQGGPNVTEINVAQPEFFKALDGFITSIPVDDWKTLLRFRLLHSAAG